MSPSAKNFQASQPTLATICLIIFRMIILVSLTQLVDSQRRADPRLYHGRRFRHGKIRGSLMSGDFYYPDATSSFSSSDDLTKNSELILKSPSFDLAYYSVFHPGNENRVDINSKERNVNVERKKFGKVPSQKPHEKSDPTDEIIQKAIRDGLLFSPEDWAARNRDPVAVAAGHRSKEISDKTVGDNSAGNMFVSKVRSECARSTICERAESYPTEYITEAVKNMQNLMPLAGTDYLDFTTRIDDGTDSPLCQSDETIWYPEVVRKNVTDSKSWNLVVNVPTYKQGLRIATCLNIDSECKRIDGVTGNLALGWTALCRQQYVYRKLVVVNEEGETVIDSFPIPSSCCCNLKYN